MKTDGKVREAHRTVRNTDYRVRNTDRTVSRILSS